MGWTLILAATTALAAPAEDSTLKVDASKVENRVSRLMYGSCIEDVNHEIYGGLYAQMIFGESFEEPPKPPGVIGWSSFGGRWTVGDGVLSVSRDLGAKAVRDELELTDGSLSCDVRLKDSQGENAGLILRVREPRVGADNWVGYEISISAKGRHISLGRHRHNYQLLKNAPADISSGRWHRLKVELEGPTLRILLDDAKEPAIVYTDSSAPIPSGRVGVRTWGSDAEFRNLVIERSEGKVAEPFEHERTNDVLHGLSGMWDSYVTGEATPRLSWDSDRPFNSTHSQTIERVSGEGTVGIVNRGLNRWGLTVHEGRMYAGHLYLRQEGYSGSVTVGLQSADGRRLHASQPLRGIGKEWGRYEFALTADSTDTNARFAVWIDGPGKVWVDQVTLSGTGSELFHGLPIRADIGKGLQAEGLTLLRYGGSMVNAPEYRWKSMVGERCRRPQYRGWWYPNSTNGFGIEEFVAFCRAAGFEPVVAINIEETPQDAADLIEYLNGPVTSPWGRYREQNGHAEPYNVKYIEIGNEETTDAHYLERFLLLYEAMRPRDPKVDYIIGAWWEPDNPVSRRIVEQLTGKAALWDVHVGGDDPREGAKVDALFTRMKRLYQEWSPGTTLKACVLEENGGQHNLRRALGHAGILNATQRHGDFVLIDCPANCLQPWHQNDNDWDQGQLFFTSSQVWGMPPYYAQQMASSAHLPCRIASEVMSPANDLDLSATRDEAGNTVVLKVVNVGDRAHPTVIAIEGLAQLASTAEVLTLTGELNDINLPNEPERIRPKKTTIDVPADRFHYEFPARSYTIIRLRAGTAR
jgi:alpha-L-arabinofuranosidase